MNLALRRFQLMTSVKPFYHLTLQMITTSTPLSPKGYDEYDSPNWETIQYAITVTNDGTIPITEYFYVTDKLTGDQWTVDRLAVGASLQFTCKHCTTQADLLAGVVINACQIDMSSELEDLWHDSDNSIEPNVPVTKDETYKPYPSVILTETSTPSNGDSYEEGETITVTVTVTGDPKYAIYEGSITSSFDNNTWNLGTLTNGEYVLAANAVNTFTWTHVVTSADITAQSLNFSATGSAEAFHEWGGDIELTIGSNILNVNTYHDYTQDYLTFEAVESSVFKLIIPKRVGSSWLTSVSYSIDNGQTWTTKNNGSSAITITTPTISQGGKVLWKGTGKRYGGDDDGYYSYFTSTGKFNVSGNILSLIYENNFQSQTTFNSSEQFIFGYLFKNNTKLVNANFLHLTPTMLKSFCYCGMFYNCTSLESAPIFHAASNAGSCCASMFYNCSSLTIPPELPAKTLASLCYDTMFYGCTSLTTAPELPATTLVNYCYVNMFYGCTNISYIKALFITEPSKTYTSNWVGGVSASGTFVKNSAATWNVTGVNGVPTGWTIQTASS